MARIAREGFARWKGKLDDGHGYISTSSGVLEQSSYSFGTRFRDEPGTNPEELIAAAHAACYSMALANTLAEEGYQPVEIEAKATCSLVSQNGGFAIEHMHLEVTGRVRGLDQVAFRELARRADQQCPVSNLLRPGLDIELDVELIESQPRLAH